jgi:hypothetical protein
MPILRIEHSITDFETWKQAFDRDPAGRERHGACAYRVLRPVDDPNYIVIDIEFEAGQEARAFADAMQGVWQSRAAAPALAGAPKARVFDLVESKRYRD